MDQCLGRFGDRRLEKGGPFFWPGFWNVAGANCVCADWEAVGRGKFA